MPSQRAAPRLYIITRVRQGGYGQGGQGDHRQRYRHVKREFIQFPWFPPPDYNGRADSVYGADKSLRGELSLSNNGFRLVGFSPI